jgi:hypothetical protein
MMSSISVAEIFLLSTFGFLPVLQELRNLLSTYQLGGACNNQTI